MIEKWQEMQQQSGETIPFSDTILTEGVAAVGGKMLLRVMKLFTGDDGEAIMTQHMDPLLAMGADITYTDPTNGFNALHCFLSNEDLLKNNFVDEDLEGGMDEYILNVLKFLVERLPTEQRAPLILSKSNDGKNLLHFAAKHDYPIIMAWALEVAGRRVEGPGQSTEDDLFSGDSDGWTPLHVACGFGNPQTARVLADHGCMQWDKTNEGQTAWEVAESRNGPLVMHYLKSPLARRPLEEMCNDVANCNASWQPNLLCILVERLLRCGPLGLSIATQLISRLVPGNGGHNNRKRDHSDLTA